MRYPRPAAFVAGPLSRTGSPPLAALLGLWLLTLGFCAPLSGAPLPDAQQLLFERLSRANGITRPLWLQQGGEPFLALFTPAQTGEAEGAAILLHDRGAHPYWPAPIRPLAETLPRHGWATLSIALAEGEQAEQQNRQRIDAAKQELGKRGLNNIVLIGHGDGARTALLYIETKGDATALVTIGLPISPGEAGRKVLERIAALPLPLLDIYGSDDLPQVRESARSRAAAARGTLAPALKKGDGPSPFAQIEFEGADHLFHHAGTRLAKRIAGWLNRHAEGITINSE